MDELKNDLGIKKRKYKDIEDIVIGDKVVSYNTELGKNVDGTVNNIFNFRKNEYYVIGLEDGGEIRVTGEHPFLVCRGWFVVSGNAFTNYLQSTTNLCDWKWMEVKDLVVGDWLRNSNGKRISVSRIERILLDKLIDVYNLEVDGVNTYYAEGVVVHNKPMENINPSFEWSSEPLKENLCYVRTLRGGTREGVELYKVKLYDGSEKWIVIKEYKIEDLVGELEIRYLLFEEDFPPVLETRITQEIFEQIKRLQEVNPDWVPYYADAFLDSECLWRVKIYEKAYVNDNPKWFGGEWSEFNKIISNPDRFDNFLDKLGNSDIKIKNKLLEQLKQLKKPGKDGIIAISDGHDRNILIWIKENPNKFIDIEIRPIDTYDTLSISNNEIREIKLDWVEQLIDDINSQIILILIH